MILYVTRHGETDYNARKRYTGSIDAPLNATGIKQAEKLAHSLSGVEFEVIVSSPLMRAKQTAEAISRLHGIPIFIIDEFAEISLGVYEGLTREEAQSQYPDIWAKLSDRPSNIAPIGGETHIQFDARIAIGLEKLRKSHDSKNVLLVCHAFTARIINRQLIGLSFEEMDAFTLGNCEIEKYEL